MVAVYATVRDRTGRLVFNLPREAFQVRDNGRAVDLTLFSNDPQPLTVVVLAGVIAHWPEVTRTLEALTSALQPQDRARIGTFGAELSLSPHLTGDKALLARVIREEIWLWDDYPVKQSGRTEGPTGEPGTGRTWFRLQRTDKIWPAVGAAMDSLSAESGRRVILVLTGDKSDLPSESREHIESRAIDESFMLYGVTVGSDQNSTLSDIAERTGGGHVELLPGADLDAVLAHVVEELRHQYLLGFVPAALDGRRHRIDVTVADRDLGVRARREYLAVGR